jgi:hypothetical protein
MDTSINIKKAGKPSRDVLILVFISFSVLETMAFPMGEFWRLDFGSYRLLF